jgi:toxin ParE1/3/4
MKLKWTEQAISDLEDISEFIKSESSISASKRVIKTISTSVKTLKDFPHLGRAGRSPNTREHIIPNTSYIAPYRVRDEELQILSIFHASRRWPDTSN